MTVLRKKMHEYCASKMTKTPSCCHLITSSQLRVIIVSLYPNIMTSSRPCLVLTFSRPYPHVPFLVFAHPHILPSSFTHRHSLYIMSSHALLPIFIFSYTCTSSEVNSVRKHNYNCMLDYGIY